ncbi:MAG: cytochrome c maturation protein CcmE [Methylococcales bacterium]|nr:cytochrome c maturation protein CcmE [Methylococcales bacterium]
MRAKRKQRLYLILLLLAGLSIAIGLTLMALKQNINLFFTPTQINSGEAPQDVAFRIGGMVVNDSVERSDQSLLIKFAITDTAQSVPVRYTGILPDLFREGQGIVALGRLDGKTFVASEVLAKHDENYMAPEAAEAIKQANANMYQSETQPAKNNDS